jgi:predicted Zn-dependent protease
MKRVLLLTLLFVRLFSSVASAAGLRWHVRAPFTAYVVATLTDPTLQARVVQSAADWSISPVVDMLVVTEAPKRAKVIIRVFADHYEGVAWAGATAISNENGWITGATVRINMNYTDGQTEQNQLRVTCHELGHAIGLQHNTYTGSCLGFGGSTPAPGDFADLEALY